MTTTPWRQEALIHLVCFLTFISVSFNGIGKAEFIRHVPERPNQKNKNWTLISLSRSFFLLRWYVTTKRQSVHAVNYQRVNSVVFSSSTTPTVLCCVVYKLANYNLSMSLLVANVWLKRSTSRKLISVWYSFEWGLDLKVSDWSLQLCICRRAVCCHYVVCWTTVLSQNWQCHSLLSTQDSYCEILYL